MRRLAFVLAASCLVDPAAASTPAALEAAGARIAAAVAALDPAQPAEERVAALADAMAAYESALGSLRGPVFDAEDRERRLTLDLLERRQEIARLLAALQTLSRTPRPAQALHPQGPLAAARAATMLAAMTPALQAEAQVLADQLAAIEEARRLRAQGLEDIAAGLAELGAARGALLAALERQEGEPDSPGAMIPATLARDAETLSALADRLADLGGAAPAPAEAAPLALRRPVAGRVLRGFQETDAAGVRRPGLLVEAPPLSLVTAPADARVRYAGPFLDYGYVVVLEPRADVLIVLAGLASLETGAGAVVREGALLGLLGGRDLEAQEYLMLGQGDGGDTPAETLYIEVRHGQGPVDPAPWFADPNQ